VQKFVISFNNKHVILCYHFVIFISRKRVQYNVDKMKRNVLFVITTLGNYHSVRIDLYLRWWV